MRESVEEITQLLAKWSGGDEAALDKLIPAVHIELRRIATAYLRRERPDHTLQSCALVNEAYLRLVNYNAMTWQSRAHFFAAAAQLMRRILVDHARKRLYGKRGGGACKIALDSKIDAAPQQPLELVALDDALKDLEALDPRKARIIELRFFTGLSIEETAEVLSISTPTVIREWAAAKAWLFRAVRKEAAHHS